MHMVYGVLAVPQPAEMLLCVGRAVLRAILHCTASQFLGVAPCYSVAHGVPQLGPWVLQLHPPPPPTYPPPPVQLEHIPSFRLPSKECCSCIFQEFSILLESQGCLGQM